MATMMQDAMHNQHSENKQNKDCHASMRDLIMPKHATKGTVMQDDHKGASSIRPAEWELVEGFPIPPWEPEF